MERSGEISLSSNLYVGDLSSICTEEDLQREFKAFGDVEEVRVQRCKKTNSSLCYGFVKMSKPSDAIAAVSGLNGILLRGRRLKVRNAEYGSCHITEIPYYPVCFKFCGLEKGCTTDEVKLREIFVRYGEIDDISVRKVFFDRKSGLHSGYGFLRFCQDQISYKLVREFAEFISEGVRYNLNFSKTSGQPKRTVNVVRGPYIAAAMRGESQSDSKDKSNSQPMGGKQGIGGFNNLSARTNNLTGSNSPVDLYAESDDMLFPFESPKRTAMNDKIPELDSMGRLISLATKLNLAEEPVQKDFEGLSGFDCFDSPSFNQPLFAAPDQPPSDSGYAMHFGNETSGSSLRFGNADNLFDSLMRNFNDPSPPFSSHATHDGGSPGMHSLYNSPAPYSFSSFQRGKPSHL